MDIDSGSFFLGFLVGFLIPICDWLSADLAYRKAKDENQKES